MIMDRPSPAPQLFIEQVEQWVQSRTGGGIRGLRVQLDGSRMVITGRTSTYYNKQLVTHAALDAAQSTVYDYAILNEVEVC